MKKVIVVIILAVLAGAGWLYFVKGYVGFQRRDAVPGALIYDAQVPGIKNIRIIVDPRRVKHDRLPDIMNASGFVKASFTGPEINILNISGGGANGAYGAGVLCGWTEAGSRPKFDIVTGVSTGALIAPAAFLGPDYDRVIKNIYTNVSNSSIVKRNLIEFFFEGRPSLFDTQPLRSVLKGSMTKEVMDLVAREHAKGRRLYVATTNLDARRLVIWDMGALASSGSPDSLELFRNIMLASASIPVAFPPVMITVEAKGKLYDEMHADGSVATQIAGSILIMGHKEVKRKRANVYVIRNGKIADMPGEVPYKVWDIAEAAFSTMITWQSYGDIYRFSAMAKYERINFYFTCIPYIFNEPRNGEFDLDYMRKLFYRGYHMTESGKNWYRQIGETVQEAAPGK